MQRSYILRANAIGLPVPSLQEYDPGGLEGELPLGVFPLHMASSQQVEVEEEIEIQAEIEIEAEQEVELQMQSEVSVKKVPSYSPRERSDPFLYRDVNDKMHKAFAPVLKMTDSYFPEWSAFSTRSAERALDIRAPFDERTNRIGPVLVQFARYDGRLRSIVIGDLLDDVPHGQKPPDSSLNCFFYYDIRQNIIVSSEHREKHFEAVLSDPQFISLIAQIKFLDGMVNGYTQAELAQLRTWIQSNGPAGMCTFFTRKILRYRPEQRFAHSQLSSLFQGLKEEMGDSYATPVSVADPQYKTLVLDVKFLH